MSEHWVAVGYSLGDDMPRITAKIRAEYPAYKGLVRVSPRDKDGFHKLEFQISSNSTPVTWAEGK